MAQYALTWGETPTSDDKLWALVAQLSPYVSTFIGPIVVLLVFQEKSAYVRYHAWQALALQGSVWIAAVIIGMISTATCGVGAVLYLLLIPFALAPIYGALLAWGGEWKGFPGIADLGRPHRQT